MKPSEYLEHLKNRTQPNEAVQGVSGRIIRGQQESHFFTLGGDMDDDENYIRSTKSSSMSMEC